MDSDTAREALQFSVPWWFYLWETAASRRDDHSIESMGMVYFPIHEWLMFMVN